MKSTSKSAGAAAKIKTNRVFLTLSGFSPEHLKRFLRFLQSPYFNQSKTLLLLGNLLADLVEKQKPGFVKEDLWNRLFPGKPYNDVNFRKACSDLLELTEQFMAVEIYMGDAQRKKLDVVDFISAHKIAALYQSAVNENEKNFREKPYWTCMDYFYSYSYGKKYHRLMGFDVKVDRNLNIGRISEDLDIFFLIEKLKIIYNSLSNNIVLPKGVDLNDIDAILKLCEKYRLEDYPELAIYFYSYKTFTDSDNHQHYYHLKATLEQFADRIPQHEAIEIFDAVLNYCVLRLNKGDKQFLQEYFDLFTRAIENGVYVVNGELASRRFTNIVIAGLRLGKLDWAHQFVQEKHQLLPETERSNMFKFNMARVCLYKKDFGKVLDYLRDVEYEDIFISLISKVMMAMSYYELDEYDALSSFLDTYRAFIQRQKETLLNDTIKKSYLNFIGFVKRIIKLKGMSNAQSEQLKQRILNNRSSIVNHEWLLEKIDELR